MAAVLETAGLPLALTSRWWRAAKSNRSATWHPPAFQAGLDPVQFTLHVRRWRVPAEPGGGWSPTHGPPRKRRGAITGSRAPPSGPVGPRKEFVWMVRVVGVEPTLTGI